MVWDSLSTAASLIWRRMGLLVAANVLWLLLSLPIVTWPAATAGLFLLAQRVVREELDGEPVEARLSDFWDGFRQYWQRSSLLTLLDVGMLALILVALMFYIRSSVEPLRWLVGPIALVGLVWLGAQLYLYPLLLYRPSDRPWETMRTALLIALGYPLSTLSLTLTAIVLFLPAIGLAGPVLFIFFSAAAVFQTVVFRQVLTQAGQEGLSGVMS
jgi:uncharacterized membrane protein YesL